MGAVASRPQKVHAVRAALCLLAVLTLQPFGNTRSEEPKSALREEALKQEAIYRSRGENIPTGYVLDRSLLSYTSILASGFDGALANLRAADRWLDIGAGQGEAILDYYTPRYDAMHRERSGKKARAVALSIEDRRTPRWHKMAATLDPDQVRYAYGRRLREYSLEELGRFKLITDLVGGFSYTRYPAVFMQKALNLLVVDGDFYTLLLDVRLEKKPQRPVAPELQLLTEIVNPDGSEGTVCSWLKSISCVRVTCEPDTKMERPIELYHIRKTCEAVSVPALELVSFQAGTPPQRRYAVKSTAANSR